ncbi:hypothetical protein DV736_g3667, partial [Chaetothyriales sp. CBS 134916]
MAPEQEGSSHDDVAGGENPTAQQITSEMARAFQELAEGERTASALESQLDDIESRIEEMLASAEQYVQEQEALKSNSRSDKPARPAK